MSEDQLLRAVIQLARACRYRVAHFRPAKTQRGRWVTAMSGDVGWPDLILCGHGRIIAAELKSDTGKCTDAQVAWLNELDHAGIPTQVWRPGDWTDGTIAKCLGVTDGIIQQRR